MFNIIIAFIFGAIAATIIQHIKKTDTRPKPPVIKNDILELGIRLRSKHITEEAIKDMYSLKPFISEEEFTYLQNKVRPSVIARFNKTLNNF